MMSGSGEPLQDGAARSELRNVPLRWWSCTACGGVSLPVRIRDGASGPADLFETSCEECPRCETRRRRAAQSSGYPSVWYDTELRDWVVRLPVAGPRLVGLLVRPPVDAVLPLELWWFDVPWVEVYRAAADLAFAAETFGPRDVAEDEYEDY